MSKLQLKLLLAVARYILWEMHATHPESRSLNLGEFNQLIKDVENERQVLDDFAIRRDNR